MGIINIVALLCLCSGPILAQADDLGLSRGYISFETSDFNVKVVNSSQTLASISPKSKPAFDFSPFDVLAKRAANGNYHLGDVAIRYRTVGTQQWIDLNSATARKPVLPLQKSGSVAASDLSPTISAGSPLDITREWGVDGGDVTLSFTAKNSECLSIEIGSFGFPVEFNSIFTSRTAKDTQANCSLTDPNIGLAGGYLRVTPLEGAGASLVVTPLRGTAFEGWRFLPEDEDTDLAYQSQVFEGFYSWEVHTLAYAEQEWNKTTPWNPPTSKILAAGESITYGLRFSLAGDVRSIEDTVKKTNTPLAIGVPGYIIHGDTSAQLHLFYNSTVSSITSDPAGAFRFNAISQGYTLTPSPSAWGRVRVNIGYANGAKQSVSYFITKSGPQQLTDLGHFLFTSQYYTNTSDPFHRAPSIISYDRSVNDYVLQDPRVWIAGLSDEGGAGAWLAAAMKQAAQPNAAEVSKLEDFIHQVVLGTLQPGNSSAVRKSVFYYQPNSTSDHYSDKIDWSNWWSWNIADAYATNRAYDYVHVSAAYWALYRVARFYPHIVRQASWDWYLSQSYNTVMYCMGTNYRGKPNAAYSELGLMGETVWGYLLDDLKAENYTTQANALEARMKRRAEAWSTQAVPYGSEMAWDSTGQEGVYYWTNYFGLNDAATKTINSILGYMPTVSHWGWNGNARRYWDFWYGGKLQRYERQIHHYGSGLNSLPLLEHFQQEPSDVYALRVGYGGNSGPLSNIDQEGFAAAAFHSWPDTLAWDAYSGDYGPNFLGHVFGAGTYVVHDKELGLLSFGGSATSVGNSVIVVPNDAVRRKVYLAMFGTQIAVEAGNIETVTYSESTKAITVQIASKVASVFGMVAASSTILKVKKMAQVGSLGTPVVTTSRIVTERGGWLVDLSRGTATIDIGFQ
ncbi:hypothetical protein ONS95_007533 [Cadophora gregata]|uniref:uncharacterized protein n=1 Tax=Cadophora gregata TaxID=51156 RepID=UPI0026DC7D9E|nr:uncharacterized protein ONS95_007533 [Cadophora gregata]KAK0125909.1 hypothetical protein ONS95_007533 [Cadophora gregata]